MAKGDPMSQELTAKEIKPPRPGPIGEMVLSPLMRHTADHSLPYSFFEQAPPVVTANPSAR